MNEYLLKYGCNPDQKPARAFMRGGGPLPFEVLGGRPGYINLLDAFGAWQLVRELKRATSLPSAASFKHVSPAGAAVGLSLSDEDRAAYFVPEDQPLSPVACAYVRARGADRLSSFGDWAALSDVCDVETARYLRREVSDGIVAPGYTPEALDILRAKKKGGYAILAMDPDYEPAPIETRDVFGVTLEEGRSATPIDADLLNDVVTTRRDLPEAARRDLILAMIALKYTQSNSVCFVRDGQTVGVGAGQQSRIHCTRLAGDKADLFFLRRHPKVLNLEFAEGLSRPQRDNAVDAYIRGEWEDCWRSLFAKRPEALTDAEKAAHIAGIRGVSVGSDAFFPFGDNIERACRSGAEYVVEPGGSLRDDDVIAAANRHNLVLCFTHHRLFRH